MEEEKIIIRKYDLITLGSNGKSYLESIGIVPKEINTKPIATQRKLARVLELRYQLSNMKIYVSAEYKKTNLNKGMQFIAAATTNTRSTYLIYDVPKTLSAKAQTQILKELKNKRNIISNVIIFTNNKSFVQELHKTPIHINELLILPPNEFSINLLNKMGEDNFDRKVISAAFPKLLNSKAFSEKQTQYMIDECVYKLCPKYYK